MIHLVVANRTVLTWQSFCRETPKFSIALDGYVRGGPRYSNAPRANFNHHEDVDRLATRATCAQVLMAIRQGLFQKFRTQDGPEANVYVNDCDEDVCTAWTLLKHHYLIDNAVNPLVNRLVAMEDALDCTAGAYPFPKDLPALQELAWVFQPYRQFRLSGALDQKNPEAYREIICDVEHRILQHLAGKGERRALDTRYERIGGGTGWDMVREIGAQARTGMFADGIRMFCSVRDRPDGRYTYVIGKMSPFYPLRLTDLMVRLNTQEDENEAWGGGDTIMGSPRTMGSHLHPAVVSRIIEECIQDFNPEDDGINRLIRWADGLALDSWGEEAVFKAHARLVNHRTTVPEEHKGALELFRNLGEDAQFSRIEALLGVEDDA